MNHAPGVPTPLSADVGIHSPFPLMLTSQSNLFTALKNIKSLGNLTLYFFIAVKITKGFLIVTTLFRPLIRFFLL